MADTITVLLVDDHALVRRGFRRLLEDDPAILVVGEAGDGDAAIRLASILEPDVVVMDWSMPGTNGLHAARRILEHLPRVAILMLSVHADGPRALDALKAGARGYALKGAADFDLAEVVRRVAAGEVVVDPGVQVEHGPRPARTTELSARQHEVLRLICNGLPNPEIATRLGLSVHTVRVHRARIMRILDVHTAGELVMHAIRRRLVDIA